MTVATDHTLQPGQLSLAQLRDLGASGHHIAFDASCRAGIRASAALVQQAAAGAAGSSGARRYWSSC